MLEEGAQNTRIWRLRTAALGGTGLRQAAMRASAPRSPHHLRLPTTHPGRDPDREPSGAKIPSGRFSHATAVYARALGPEARLPGRGRPRLITTWHGRGR